MDCVFETEQLQYTPNAPIKKRWILRGLGVASGVGNIIAIQNKIKTFNFDDPYNPLTTETITTDYYHSNHRGDIVFTTDEWGSKKATLRYDAFGNTIYESNAENVKYRFSSKEWDSVAQLYYYGFRWYDPEHGIWISKDPIGLSAGDLNVYRMVFNNPIGLVDSYGQFAWLILVPIGLGALYLTHTLLGPESPTKPKDPSKKWPEEPKSKGPLYTMEENEQMMACAKERMKKYEEENRIDVRNLQQSSYSPKIPSTKYNSNGNSVPINVSLSRI